MLTAIKESTNEKVIGDVIEKDPNEIYTCDECRTQVIHHKSESKVKIGHFKHKAKQSDCSNTGETMEHLQCKLQIYNYLKNTYNFKILEVEKWIENRAIRPDIYIETKRGNRIAIEVQASRLTVDSLKMRTERYSKHGIYVLWVLPYRFDSSAKGLSGDVVKLKEYEVFLFWCYYKNIVYWKHDNGEFYSNGSKFVVVPFSHYGQGNEKYINKPIEGFPFDGFQPTKAKAFAQNNKQYDIPERSILTPAKHFFEDIRKKERDKKEQKKKDFEEWKETIIQQAYGSLDIEYLPCDECSCDYPNCHDYSLYLEKGCQKIMTELEHSFDRDIKSFLRIFL